MHIVHVFIKVKPEAIDAFKIASLENAHKSLQEAGVVRFDVLQEHQDAAGLVLVEVYRTKEDAELHKATDHYKIWRDLAEPMMAEPRSRIIYKNIHPVDADWV